MSMIERCTKLLEEVEKFRKLGMLEKAARAEKLTIEAIAILAQCAAENVELRRRIERLEAQRAELAA